MSSIRLHMDEPLAAGAVVEAGPRRSHYLATVMRMGAGDPLSVFNPRDGEFQAAVELCDRRRCRLALGRRLRHPAPEPDVRLLFAPIKRAPIDFLARKAAELGASALWPVTTTLTAARRVGLDRMRANAVEAAERCGRLSVPEVLDPAPLDKVLAEWPAGRRLFWCDESGGGRAAAQAFAAAPAGPAAILVGPEGGFSDAERAGLRSHEAASAVDLGPRLMRAETAAFAALACWQAVAGDWTRAASPAG